MSTSISFDQASNTSSLHSSHTSRSSIFQAPKEIQGHHARSSSNDSIASSISIHSPQEINDSKAKAEMNSTPSTSTSKPKSASTDSKKRKESPNSSSDRQSPSSPSNHIRLHDGLGAGSDGSSRSPAVGDSSTSSSKKASNQQSKRIKTARACDSCRRKKIRCDVIDDGSATLGNPNNGNGGLICAHCKQYGFGESYADTLDLFPEAQHADLSCFYLIECTFFLPITETRFKKKKEREAEERAAAAAAASATGGSHMRPHSLSSPFQPAHNSHMMTSTSAFSSPSSRSLPSIQQTSPVYTASVPIPLESKPPRISASQEWPRPPSEGARRSASASVRKREYEPKDVIVSPKSAPAAKRQASKPFNDAPPPPDTRVLGPTSIAYIVHSTAFVPGAAIEQHDLKHHQTFEVGASGDGIIKFHKPPKNHAAMADGEDAGDAYDIAKIPEWIRGRLAGDVAEKLVNVYFEKVGYLFPVMTKSEFLHLSPPPPLLLYSICGVAALSRDVPKEVLAAVKSMLNSLFRDMDLLSNSNNNTVKALLIMSLHSDLHGNTAVQGGTRCWNRVGSAIRMAQDLGLHRDASGRDDLDDDAFFLEQKRRIWGCCVTADRCMSVSLGHPLAIDLTDCDVRLPSPHELLRFPSDLPTDSSTDRPFAFNTEMLKLSILFGRVMKTVYSPTGLMKTNDEDIVGLLTDIDRWKEMLPAPLQFKGPTDSSVPAGILHVSFACLMHLLFRVFMRISYNCPKHLGFSLTIERMTKLIHYSRESIEWVDLNDFYLDTLQFVSYGLVFCATIQYHAWIRRGDHHALATLKRARECVTRFKRQGEHDASEELSMRAKTAEVITMLHDSALGAYAHGPNTGNLNPTAGVTNRRTADTVRGIVFKPDTTRPGGGVYVATNPNLVLNDLPKGTIILQQTESGRVPALVRTDQEINGGWQPIESGRGNGNNGISLNDSSTSGFNNINSSSNGLNRAQNGTSSQEDLPTAPDLTYVAGDVWTDAEGRPVDRRGSRLMTMIPIQQANGDDASMPGQQYLINAMPRLSFSDISGINSTKTSDQQSSSATNNLLNDSAWLNAMSNSMPSSSGSFPNMIAFNDNNYAIDGQPVFIPAHMISGGMDTRGSTGLTPGGSIGANSVYGFGGVGNIGFNGGIQMVDPLSLDEMPGGPLDFAAWDSWFRTASIYTGDTNTNTATTQQ